MYAQYVFYKDTYHGTMSETSFSIYGARASDEIDVLTFDRLVSQIPAEMQTRVATACCAVADALLEQDRVNTRIAGGALKSATNDGVSESYITAAEAETATRKKVMSICAKYLSFPVNLVYRGY